MGCDGWNLCMKTQFKFVEILRTLILIKFSRCEQLVQNMYCIALHFKFILMFSCEFLELKNSPKKHYVFDRNLKNLSVAWCPLVWTSENNISLLEWDSCALP